MAPPTKEATTGVDDEKIQMLKEGLKCVSGTLDFEQLAVRMGVANGEAMRKRFKRFFEKDEEPLQLKGSVLGATADNDTPVAPKTPKTPRSSKVKVKASTSNDDEDASATPKTKAASKKRKLALNDSEANSDAAAASEPDNAVKEELVPKKKTKAVKEPKSPKTPRTPKTPGTPRIPKTPKTPKRVSSDDTAIGLEDNGGSDEMETKQHVNKLGSPEIQAKTDSMIKDIERSGTDMGEPEKQAINDAVKKESGASEGEE